MREYLNAGWVLASSRFIIAGIINTVLGFFIFVGTSQMFSGRLVFVSVVLSYVASSSSAFFLNRNWVFPNGKLTWESSLLRSQLLLVPVGLSNVLAQEIFSVQMDFPPNIVQLAFIGFFVPVTFFLNRHWAFKG